MGAKTTSASKRTEDASIKQDAADIKFCNDILAAINGKRKLHGVSALSLNDELTLEAQRWALHCASLDAMKHKQDKKYGENIYRLTANMPVDKSVVRADHIVDQWYAEGSQHDYGREPQGAKLITGHFTQIVWCDSRRLGAALALSASKKNIYVVTFFSPKGNWMGEFASQVPPLGGFKTVPSKQPAAPIDFNSEVLDKHNELRAVHSVKPLALSDKLNGVAQEWANRCARTDTMQHRDNNEYGENLYSKWSSKPGHSMRGDEPVVSWYSEIHEYMFGSEPSTLAAGHFTQVVWATTERLGVGQARCESSGKLYVVCNYEPAGNFVGQFSSMVPPPKKK